MMKVSDKEIIELDEIMTQENEMMANKHDFNSLNPDDWCNPDCNCTSSIEGITVEEAKIERAKELKYDLDRARSPKEKKAIQTNYDATSSLKLSDKEIIALDELMTLEKEIMARDRERLGLITYIDDGVRYTIDMSTIKHPKIKEEWNERIRIQFNRLFNRQFNRRRTWIGNIIFNFTLDIKL